MGNSRRSPPQGRPVIAQPRATAARPLTPLAVASDDPLQTFVFRASLVLLFLHCSMIHEVVAHKFGVNLYAMFILIPLCTVGLFLTNGIQVALRHTAVKYWILLAFWAIVCIPFSSWKGGSLESVMSWYKAPVETALIYAGTFTTWRHMRTALYVVAAALPVNIMTARIFTGSGERLRLEFGSTIGNSNDFAGHLLLISGVAVFVALTRKTIVSRLAILALVAVAMTMVFRTGSRGALVGVVVTVLVLFVRATVIQRVLMVVAIPVLALAVFAGVPPDVRDRLLSFQTDRSEMSEAVGSQMAREYLFKASIRHTLTHPLFGVGPGQFGSYEGRLKVERGGHGTWHSTHNSITQISSECGLPGAFFLCGALVLSWGTLKRIWREGAALGLRDISKAAFWLSISFAGFVTASMFLNFGWLFHYPTLIGLAAGLKNAFEQEKSLRLARAAGALSTPVEKSLLFRSKNPRPQARQNVLSAAPAVAEPSAARGGRALGVAEAGATESSAGRPPSPRSGSSPALRRSFSR